MVVFNKSKTKEYKYEFDYEEFVERVDKLFIH